MAQGSNDDGEEVQPNDPAVDQVPFAVYPILPLWEEEEGSELCLLNVVNEIIKLISVTLTGWRVHSLELLH